MKLVLLSQYYADIPTYYTFATGISRASISIILYSGRIFKLVISPILRLL